MTRSNTAADAVHKSDALIVLMDAVSGVVNKTYFKIAFERDHRWILQSFTTRLRYWCQEDAKAENAEFNVVEDGGPSREGYIKDKEKQKAEDSFGGSKR